MARDERSLDPRIRSVDERAIGFAPGTNGVSDEIAAISSHDHRRRNGTAGAVSAARGWKEANTEETLDMARVIGTLALLLACSAASFAQGVQTGTIRGTVKDQQGLALPGATITATSAALQGERTVVTDTDGNFLFRAIPPGTYKLKVELSGMSPVQKTADVPLGGVAQIDISMLLSQVQE